MSSFANLKKQSGSSNLDKLSKAIEALNEKAGDGKPDNFWKPEVDKAGNGMATIRFLPSSSGDGEDALPWVKIFSHGFKGPGGWLIDNCLTTKNEQCPICEHNSRLWNSGIEADKKIVSQQKRKLNYISNVYIVSDPKHPENEGKVFLFRYGKKIFDKLTEAMNPAFEDETPINPFDLWKGANFKLKIRKVDGFQNYDKSEFESSSPLSKDDDELENIWKAEHTLKDLLVDKEFKTYDQLKDRLSKVLGESEAPVRASIDEKPKAEKAPSPAKAKNPDAAPWEEDDSAYFDKLAAMDD
jgi:hypothetical protein